MGQKRKYFKIARPSLDPGHATLSRTKMGEILGDAVDEMKEYYPNGTLEAHGFPEEELRHLHETTDVIDRGTWKCEGSCGCPLTQVLGLELLNIDSKIEPGMTNIPSPIAAFAGFFDTRTRGLSKISATIITLTDD